MIEKWDDSKPLVSVYIVTFNQEKYIAHAIESVLMQETNFDYEVLIGDDCSTDGTRKIIESYVAKHPGRLVPFYMKKNTYHDKDCLFYKLERKCNGKYMILLEGDDYWIDSNKLQIQADFLEEHCDYVAVAHKCIVVDENSKRTAEIYPECYDNVYNLSHWFSGIMPGQTTTFMRRNPKYYDIDVSITQKGLPGPGDQLKYFCYALNGKIGCLPDIMSAYRHVLKGGSSFSATFEYDIKKADEWYSAVTEYAYIHGNPKVILNAEVMYLTRVNIYAFRTGILPFKSIFKLKYKKSGYINIWFHYFMRIFKKIVMHEKLYVRI